MALSTAVTGFVLAMPVVSSGAPTSTSLDSTSNTAARHTDESSPVVMGRDGDTAPSTATVTPVVPPVVMGRDGAAAPSTATATATATDTLVVPPAPEEPAPAPAVSVTPEPPAPRAAPAPTTTTEASAPTTAAASPAGTSAPGTEAEVIALVNSVRAGAGCGPVVHDEGLARVAREHSADMRDQNFFDHVNLAGLDPFDRAEAAGQTNARAENIAHGQRSPAGVMDDWMDSSGHRGNILNCELRTLGVGVAEGPGGPWWTQLFGD